MGHESDARSARPQPARATKRRGGTAANGSRQALDKSHPRIVVAILNSNDDIVEMLRQLLDHAGFVTVSAHVDEIKRGSLDLLNFMRQHDPAVIVYDLVPPYESSWNYLQMLRDSPVMRGRQFILTSVNAERAQQVVGRSKVVYEILGKPLDLDQVVMAVKEASRQRLEPHAHQSHGSH